MTTWTKGDDAAVCLSYRDHGVKATPELIAALFGDLVEAAGLIPEQSS